MHHLRQRLLAPLLLFQLQHKPYQCYLKQQAQQLAPRRLATRDSLLSSFIKEGQKDEPRCILVLSVDDEYDLSCCFGEVLCM